MVCKENSLAYNVGDQLEIQIKKIVPNGLGMGFAEKLTVFVPLAVRGDTVAVEIRQITGRTAFASILKVLEPAPTRTDAVCEYFGSCGGCDFQQMEYDEQLAAKAGIIEDCLKRIGHIKLEEGIEVLASKERTGYRLRTQFHIDGREHAVGFFRRQSHEVIDIERCPVLTDDMNRSLSEIRTELDRYADSVEVTHIEAAAVSDRRSFYAETLFEPVDELITEAAGERFAFNARSFFQANIAMLDSLVDTVVAGESGKRAVDFYCGAGLFSVPLARRFETVIGIESNSDSVGFAKRNRELAGLENLELFEGRVREYFKRSDIQPADLVLVDPPRNGVKKNVLGKIAGLCRERFVYVSCNPSTLARDIAILLTKGFEIETIRGLDLFPQTHHVETVVKLRRVT
ncbi:MAG: class I SAM-dependent RNA methyltransferase [Pyrinomonadaceae bacterium]|nr:class I SAM-dependent RNA methyltransferase [Pyrinomonadaceae bacterium]